MPVRSMVLMNAPDLAAVVANAARQKGAHVPTALVERHWFGIYVHVFRVPRAVELRRRLNGLGLAFLGHSLLSFEVI